eukprot:363663-Rhodomonas_salina.1
MLSSGESAQLDPAAPGRDRLKRPSDPSPSPECEGVRREEPASLPAVAIVGRSGPAMQACGKCKKRARQVQEACETSARS